MKFFITVKNTYWTHFYIMKIIFGLKKLQRKIISDSSQCHIFSMIDKLIVATKDMNLQ
jgi:hypothetical protein